MELETVTGTVTVATAGLDTILTLIPVKGTWYIIRGAIITFNKSKYALAQIKVYIGGVEMAFGGVTSPIQTRQGIHGWGWSGYIQLREGETLKLEGRTNETSDFISGVVFYEVIK